MKYDPIMCMMVDDSVKTKDAKSYGKYKLPNGDIVDAIDRKNVHGVDTIVYKDKSGVHFANVDWFMSNAKKVRDSASDIDKAIRSCDEQIRLVKTISKKNGYAIHIVEGGYGEQIVLTFPNESYANPHMWLGPNNSSNIQNAKNLLDAFSK